MHDSHHDWDDAYADPEMSRDAFGPDPDAGTSWLGKAMVYGVMLCMLLVFVVMMAGLCR